MQVSNDVQQKLTHTLQIVLSPEIIMKALDTELRALAKHTKIDGFRKGKIPLAIIQERYGKTALETTLSSLVEKEYKYELKKRALFPVAPPTFSMTEPYRIGQKALFTAVFEVYPEIALAPFESLVLERPHCEITETDVDEMIQKLREQQMQWHMVHRAAANGDRLTIDLKGTIDGEAFEGGSGEDVLFVVGKAEPLPGLSEALQGRGAGATTTLEHTYPIEDANNYIPEALRGKKAEFTVVLRAIEQGILPELDEEFIKRFGQFEQPDVEGFRMGVRANMERQLRRLVYATLRQQVAEQLCDLHQIALPNQLVQATTERFRQMAVSRFLEMNISKTEAEAAVAALPDDHFSEQAKKRVKLELLLGKIIEVHQITVKEDNAKALLQDEAANYENPEEFIQALSRDPEQVKLFRDVVLEQETIAFIASRARISEKTRAFRELFWSGDAATTAPKPDQDKLSSEAIEALPATETGTRQVVVTTVGNPEQQKQGSMEIE